MSNPILKKMTVRKMYISSSVNVIKKNIIDLFWYTNKERQDEQYILTFSTAHTLFSKINTEIKPEKWTSVREMYVHICR